MSVIETPRTAPSTLAGICGGIIPTLQTMSAQILSAVSAASEVPATDRLPLDDRLLRDIGAPASDARTHPLEALANHGLTASQFLRMMKRQPGCSSR